MSDEEQQELLRILEGRGRAFLGSFALPIPIGGNAEESQPKGKKRKVEESSEEEEEWTGFGSHTGEESDAEDAEDDAASDEEPAQQPNVIIFSECHFTAGPSGGASKAKMKTFMSSKVTKLTEEVEDTAPEEDELGDDDDDLTNAQNDALLHRLVHTRLLSGSLNPELRLTSAQRKKALAGRVLEVAGKAKLGKGEGAVRSAERNKAAKHVRDGMVDKQEERRKKELEEAKHLGNYHPTLKRLYEASDSKPRSKKREKGLRMGVGSFKGGVLRLSREEINSVQGNSGRGRSGGPHKRGGKRR